MRSTLVPLFTSCCCAWQIKMMHEAVTKSPSPANFYQHTKSEDLLSSNQTKVNMLSAAGGASRRPQSVGLQKRACAMSFCVCIQLIHVLCS